MKSCKLNAGKLPFPSLLFALCLIFCLKPAKATAADDSLQSLQGKQVMLRNFYCGEELKFDADVKLVTGGSSGAWTLCRDIRIDRIGLNDGKLKIEGQRIPLVYDSDEKQFLNALEVADNKKEGYKRLVKGQKVSLEVLLPPAADDRALAATLAKLFYSSEEQFSKDAPEYWQPFFQRLYGRKPDSGTRQGEDAKPVVPAGENSQGVTHQAGNAVFHVGNRVQPPVPIFAPDPHYSEAARLAAYHGTTVMTVIVGPDGKVYHPTVTRPLGMGLDEQARDKVLTWKFKPATKDGAPVAVEVSLEIQFNLY